MKSLSEITKQKIMDSIKRISDDPSSTLDDLIDGLQSAWLTGLIFKAVEERVGLKDLKKEIAEAFEDFNLSIEALFREGKRADKNNDSPSMFN